MDIPDPKSNPEEGQPEGEAPKLHIDSDWKAQAQAEKERLAQEAEKQGAEAGEGKESLPPADFRGLVGAMATQALLYLGGFPDEQGRAMFAPEYARHYIDLLGVLDEKTRGNLTDEESKELTGVLHELRSRFVQIVQSVAAQSAGQGGGAPGGAPGGGPAGGPAGPSGPAGPGLHTP